MTLPRNIGGLSCSAALMSVLLGSTAAVAGGVSAQAPAADAVAQRACIDPATGRLVTPAQRPECKAAFEEAGDGAGEDATPAHSAEGLEEERLEGGGAKVDLEGRFRQEEAAPPGQEEAAPPGQEEAAPPGQEEAAPPATQGPRQGGLIAFIDPRTGRPVSGAAAALMQRSPAARQALREFEEQLQEMVRVDRDVTDLQEQQLERGGVKLDLEGKFRNPLVGQIGEDGGVVISHPRPEPAVD